MRQGLSISPGWRSGHYVAQDSLELTVVLCLNSKCCDYRNALADGEKKRSCFKNYLLLPKPPVFKNTVSKTEALGMSGDRDHLLRSGS